LLDRESKEFKKRNLEYYIFDTLELLMESPTLFKTPILRKKDKVTLGYCPEIWKTWDIVLKYGKHGQNKPTINYCNLTSIYDLKISDNEKIVSL